MPTRDDSARSAPLSAAAGASDGAVAIGQPSTCDELEGIARRLLRIAGQWEGSGESAIQPQSAARPPATDYHDAFLVTLAQFVYRSRRRRGLHFDDSMFGEGAWDMLLDLYIHAVEGKRVTTTSACIGAAVPLTTGLRYISLLVEKGLVQRELSIEDARVTYVTLTKEGLKAMRQFLAAEVAIYREPSTFMLRR
jgi:predicted transcriptional regulator